MKKYIVKRLLQLIPILIGITLLSFILMQASAMDAVDVMEQNTCLLYTSDGQAFSDRGVGKSVFELFANLVDEWYIHLVVQEAVHLQYITRLYRAVF